MVHCLEEGRKEGEDAMYTPMEFTSRGYLPRDPRPHVFQMVTFRLADSVPGYVNQKIIDKITRLFGKSNCQAFQREYEKLLFEYMDLSIGSCILGRPEIANILFQKLISLDHERYELLAWSIMPNHVHLLLYILEDLSKSLKLIKGGSAHAINKFCGTQGTTVWQPEAYTRTIRTLRHFQVALEYILDNPKKGNCSNMFTGRRFDIEEYMRFFPPF